MGTMALVIALITILAFMEFRATQNNIGAVWNGYGAVHPVLTKTASAPAQYRVLVPWLLRPVPRKWRVQAYLALKIILLSLSLFAAEAVLGGVGVVILALFIALTFEFDYWDCYSEIIGVCLILTGEPVKVLIGSAIWGLSKETVFFAVPLALFSGGAGSMFLAFPGTGIFYLVMRVQGKADLYSQRWARRKMRLKPHMKTERRFFWRWLGFIAIWVVGSYNPGDLAQSYNRKDVGPWISLTWSLLAVVLGFTVWGTPVAMTYWIGLGWVLAGWTLVRVRETRTMLPSAIWMAAALVNYA